VKTYETVESYADHIRIETVSIMHLLMGALGPEHRITAKVCDLLNEAVEIVNGTQMERERGAIETLDLATLPPVSAGGTGENPFAEE
jgi:hypothetical protein